VWCSVDDDDDDQQQRDVPGGINRKAKMDKQVFLSPLPNPHSITLFSSHNCLYLLLLVQHSRNFLANLGTDFKHFSKTVFVSAALNPQKYLGQH